MVQSGVRISQVSTATIRPSKADKIEKFGKYSNLHENSGFNVVASLMYVANTFCVLKSRKNIWKHVEAEVQIGWLCHNFLSLQDPRDKN